MICNKCKKEIENDSKFCGFCGFEQGGTKKIKDCPKEAGISSSENSNLNTVSTNHTEEKSSLLSIISISIVVIVVIIAWKVESNKKEPIFKDKVEIQKPENSDEIKFENIDSSTRKFLSNNNYTLDGINYKFTNGSTEDLGNNGSGSIERIVKTKYTNELNEYTIYIAGNWGGGNSFWGYVLVGTIKSGKFNELFIENSSTEPKITNSSLTTIIYKYTDDDPRCCPSFQLLKKYIYDNNKFILESTIKEKRN